MSKVQDQYAAEQAQLQRELDGDDLTVTPPVEPEVNPEVYRDVEPLLFRGFLAMPAEINGVVFVFKSLNHHEFELLQLYGGGNAGNIGADDDFWCTFLAHGVFVAGGVNILPERERWTAKLAELFRTFPQDAVSRMVRYMSELNRRATVAAHLTEAYAMELMSRYRWLQVKGMDLSSVAITGVDGTQRLGLNHAQQAWRAINSIDDRNEAQERDWEHAKFIGSCFAGKGISKIYNQDTRRRRQEREDRMTRKDKILRQWILGETPKENTVIGPGVIMTVPRTVEELTAQLERDIRGEKDWHDRVVEDHETRVKANYAARREQLEQAQQASLQRAPERGVMGGGSHLDHGYSPAEVEERVRRRKQIMAQEVARMQVNHESSERTLEFMDRWMGDVQSSLATTNRDPQEAQPIAPARPTTVPFSRK